MRRFIRPVTSVLGVLLATAAIVTPASASSSATGDAAAIAAYRAAASATNALPVIQDTVAHLYFLKDSASSIRQHGASGVQLVQGVTQPGFVTTRVVRTFRLSAGHIVWVLTKVSPECATAGACRNAVAVQYFDTASSEETLLMSGASSRYCDAQSVPSAKALFGFTPGLGVWTLSGNFSSLARQGAQQVITSQYPSSGSTVTETDYVNAATRHFTKSVYVVAATSRSPRVTFSVAETDPLLVPATPHFRAC